MPTYIFAHRFRATILAGTQDQTIRPHRRNHARIGSIMHLYEMTDGRSSIIAIAKCLLAEDVKIQLVPNALRRHEIITPSLSSFWSPEALSAFAIRSGFSNWEEMLRHLQKLYPGQKQFEGTRLVWDKPRGIVPMVLT